MDYKPRNHEKYLAMKKHAEENPEEFWAATAKETLNWIKSDFTNVIGEIGEENSFWFDGGVMNTCYNAVDRWAAANPDKVALIYEGNEPSDSYTITFGQLKEKVCKMANVLLQHGIKKGMTVALYLPVSVECIISMLACTRIGAIHTVIFGAFAGDALSYRISNSEATAVVSADWYMRGQKKIPMKKTLLSALENCPLVKHVIISNLEETQLEEPKYTIESFQTLLEAAPAECECQPMQASDPLFILYTSGSTGEPKGIIHRVGGYSVASALTFKYVFDIDADSVFGCTSDLGWITGHSYVCYGPLLNGIPTLIFGSFPLYPNAKRSWELISKLHLTHFYTSPSAARAIAAHIKDVDQVKEYDISSLRVIGSVGETLDEETCIYLHDVLGQKKCWIVDTYWQTELGSIIATSVPGIEKLPPGIVGRPLFGTDIVLIDTEDHHVVASTRSSPPNQIETGLLCIATPWPGLANAAFKSNKSFKERYIVKGTHYFSTGDTAQIDTKGYIRITGRIDDQLCVNGHRVGPAEVEEAIMKLDDVHDVAVVGIPSKQTTQAIVAFVVAKVENEQMKKAVSDTVTQNFGAIGRPQKIIFVKALPKTNSAKIIRMLLKDLLLGKRGFQLPHTLSNPQDIDGIIQAIDAEMK